MQTEKRDARHGVDAVIRDTQITEGPGLDAVLNWSGGEHQIKPGGEGDTGNLPSAASNVMGTGDKI